MYNFTTFNFIDFKIKYDNYDIVGDIVMEDNKSYKLLDRDGRTYLSKEKGSLGGNKRLKIYGRLDCHLLITTFLKGSILKIGYSL